MGFFLSSKKVRRVLRAFSILCFLIGVFFILLGFSSFTGFSIGFFLRDYHSFFYFLGISFISISFLVFVILKSVKEKPEHLYAYVPNECLVNGIYPGGWDPYERVVPAFDPEKFSPEEIKSSFDFGDERSLVEIVGKSKENFFPRLTGPKREAYGIYASEDYVPPSDIKVVGEDDYLDDLL